VKHRFAWCLLLLAPALASGQALKLESLDKLAAKASETVNVNLDGSLLRLASRFLSSNDADEVQVKKIVAGLKGVYVRNYEFAKAGQYQDSDIEAIRNQLRDAKWHHVVEVRGRNNNADVCLRQDGDNITGLAVIVAESLELTVVYIDGPIDMDGLSKLSGNFGIPEGIRNKVERKSK
jgi:Domain of unknown function (DUF4252)